MEDIKVSLIIMAGLDWPRGVWARVKVMPMALGELVIVRSVSIFKDSLAS